MSRTIKKSFKCLSAEFYDEAHYDEIIKDECVLLKENGDILAVFVKGSIKKENRENIITGGKRCRQTIQITQQ